MTENTIEFVDETEDSLSQRVFKTQKQTFKQDLKKLNKKGKTYFTNMRKDLKNKSFYKKVLHDRLPIVNWLLVGYNFKESFLNDLMAGFTVGIMNLPQSMAYALLANLAPVNGLYMSFFPVLIYSLFGTSRHVAIGTIAIISLMSGDVIQHMADKYSETHKNLTLNSTGSEEILEYKVFVASSLAFFVGLVQILMVRALLIIF